MVTIDQMDAFYMCAQEWGIRVSILYICRQVDPSWKHLQQYTMEGKNQRGGGAVSSVQTQTSTDSVCCEYFYLCFTALLWVFNLKCLLEGFLDICICTPQHSQPLNSAVGNMQLCII